MILYETKGFSPNNQLSIKDLERPHDPVARIATEADAIYSPIANDGTRFWMHTTSEAPNGRVVEVDLARSGREDRKTILPESSNHLDSVSMIDDTLIANYLADAQSLLR